MRTTTFRSSALAIALVGVSMAPARLMAQAAPAAGPSKLQTTGPTIRPGEFYAAPWVERAGGPPNAGSIVGTGEIPGIPLTEAERPLQSHERVFVTVPPGMSSAPGARYLSVRRGPAIER